MRFDLVDLQLFIAVADARSITRGALRAHLALASASARIKGLEAGAGRRTVEARPARRRIDRGRRKPARSCPHRHPQCRMRCAAILPAYASGVKASVHLLANTSGLSEHLPKALAGVPARTSRHQRRCRGAREHRHRHRDRQRRRRSRFRRRACPAGSCRAVCLQRGPADAGGVAARRVRGPAPDRFSRGGRSRFRRADQRDRAAWAISPNTPRGSACACASARGLRDFDAICQMVAADVGMAVVPEAAARRCAAIDADRDVRIRDPWANRRLAICARSFKALPRPARATGGSSAQGGAAR